MTAHIVGPVEIVIGGSVQSQGVTLEQVAQRFEGSLKLAAKCTVRRLQRCRLVSDHSGMIIGIAGGSCSGKTTLAHALAATLGAPVVSLDDFFGNPATFPVVLGGPDYDRVEAVDWQGAASAVEAASSGGTVLVEGFLALAHPPMRALFDCSFFIDADERTMLSRRLVRERMDRHDHVRAVVPVAYRRLVMPSRQYATWPLEGRQSAEEVHRQALALLALSQMPPRARVAYEPLPRSRTIG